ncbi:hypothetical protein FHW83_001764 [Duganella sp. SG902]|uniref:hypothetical protein n=1 Tax=Duganella sp. SG902 TaxID=2587016 RepID=UPI00159DE1AA|nr:hypothetical protein [Duganella sp. SG902]NVM75977.1 hypothetical protein [Duganella sp. SG902]
MKLFFFILYFSAACAAAAEPVFWSKTEAELTRTMPAPAGLIQHVLSGEDENDRRLLHECMREQDLKKGQEAALFLIAPLTVSRDAQKAYFVRPALKPYCSAFYGAHLFRYWLVTRNATGKGAAYRTIFKSGSDGVGVLPSSANGYNDLLVYSHNALSQYWVVLKFDGREYKEASCEKKDFQEEVNSRHSRAGGNPC